MSQFKFLYPEWRQIEAAAWLRCWAALNEITNEHREDNRVYRVLIGKRGSLSSEDFEQIGRWKEGCLKENHGSWKPKTPKAYEIWMQAKRGLPICPAEDRIAEFLEDWSGRKFTAWVEEKSGREHEYKFGLPRATTLLHFISGGRFPIFDSNVGAAMSRLGSPIKETVEGYLNSFRPLFSELAACCGVSDADGLRLLDNALVCCGAENVPVSIIDSGYR